MNKVLITGVCGLLGSHFSRYLLDNGYNVIGIDDLSGGYIENLDPRIKFYKSNLIDSESIADIFKTERPDYVYHFAAYAAEGLSPFIKMYNYNNNVVCSANIINACVNYNIKKIIFTSSMAVYGESKPPFSEDMTPCPIDSYGIAKFCVEQELKITKVQFGLPYTIIRPHNIIGTYQNIWDKYRNVCGIWIRKIINRQPISIFGTGNQTRAFSDVNYYMVPFEKVMFGFDSEIFNLGADKYIKIIEMADIVKNIAKRYGYNAEIQYLQERHEVTHAFCNHDKAKKMLGFVDNTDLEKTIDNMFSWALTQPNRQVKSFGEYEINKNMYEFWK